MSKRDLVIGAITGYDFPQIAPWVNSLDRSGFTGIKAVVAYNVSYATLTELTSRGYVILAFQKDESNQRVIYPKESFSIVVERFLHYYLMLDTPENAEQIRYIIATDVKDVIFQTNPSLFFDQFNEIGESPELIVSSEGIQYQHEAWGANNMLQAFGRLMFDKHKGNTIYNCGVLAGKFETFMGLCKSIYLISTGTIQQVPGGGGPDQAALNLLLSTNAYRLSTTFVDHTYPWAAQLGTMMDPNKIESYRPHLLEPLPVFDSNTGLMMTPYEIPYAIVHQWDRVPEMRQSVERLYAV